MIGHEAQRSTAENYRRFAELEARGRSPVYERWAAAVAADADVLHFLDRLPPSKRQPNLLFAAVRWLAGTPGDYAALRSGVLDRADELEQVMLARRTQTNEPARCTALLPALAGLPQPLALLEVGASAGLTLLPDRYGYDYAGHRIRAPDPQAPVLLCEPRGPVPLPERLPEVAWRAGIDLNPLDVSDDDDVEWLRCLIWPGQQERVERLDAAVAVARRNPPRRGCRTRLPRCFRSARRCRRVPEASSSYETEPHPWRRRTRTAPGSSGSRADVHRDEGVAGFDIAGAEAGHPPTRHLDVTTITATGRAPGAPAPSAPPHRRRAVAVTAAPTAPRRLSRQRRLAQAHRPPARHAPGCAPGCQDGLGADRPEFAARRGRPRRGAP